jgi:predicted phage-related endonuclease
MSATPIGASPISSWMVATLDGIVEGTEAVFEAKFILPWSFSEEAAAEKYMAQVQHNMWVTHLRTSVLSIITGGGKWVEITIRMDPLHPRCGILKGPSKP